MPRKDQITNYCISRQAAYGLGAKGSQAFGRNGQNYIRVQL
jgi:hypothetical protein